MSAKNVSEAVSGDSVVLLPHSASVSAPSSAIPGAGNPPSKPPASITAAQANSVGNSVLTLSSVPNVDHNQLSLAETHNLTPFDHALQELATAIGDDKKLEEMTADAEAAHKKLPGKWGNAFRLFCWVLLALAVATAFIAMAIFSHGFLATPAMVFFNYLSAGVLLPTVIAVGMRKCYGRKTGNEVLRKTYTAMEEEYKKGDKSEYVKFLKEWTKEIQENFKENPDFVPKKKFFVLPGEARSMTKFLLDPEVYQIYREYTNEVDSAKAHYVFKADDGAEEQKYKTEQLESDQQKAKANLKLKKNDLLRDEYGLKELTDLEKEERKKVLAGTHVNKVNLQPAEEDEKHIQEEEDEKHIQELDEKNDAEEDAGRLNWAQARDLVANQQAGKSILNAKDQQFLMNYKSVLSSLLLGYKISGELDKLINSLDEPTKESFFKLVVQAVSDKEQAIQQKGKSVKSQIFQNLYDVGIGKIAKLLKLDELKPSPAMALSPFQFNLQTQYTETSWNHAFAIHKPPFTVHPFILELEKLEKLSALKGGEYHAELLRIEKEYGLIKVGASSSPLSISDDFWNFVRNHLQTKCSDDIWQAFTQRPDTETDIQKLDQLTDQMGAYQAQFHLIDQKLQKLVEAETKEAHAIEEFLSKEVLKGGDITNALIALNNNYPKQWKLELKQVMQKASQEAITSFIDGHYLAAYVAKKSAAKSEQELRQEQDLNELLNDLPFPTAVRDKIKNDKIYAELVALMPIRYGNMPLTAIQKMAQNSAIKPQVIQHLESNGFHID